MVIAVCVMFREMEFQDLVAEAETRCRRAKEETRVADEALRLSTEE